MSTIVAAAAALLIAATPVRGATTAGATLGSALSGTVVDASGAPVPGAVVRVATAEVLREVRTGADGRFSLALPEGFTGLLIAEAPGFAPARVRMEPALSGRPLRLLLQPAPLTESLTVTASRGAGLESPAAVTVLSAAELLNAPAPTLDDVLRGTPGFSLFRRSSSRVTNPSAQAGTLRGLSGTAASRTLVLADGLPLNDAFGSWVYWNRVPQAAIERVEVARGAAGDLYGADALGGAVRVLTFAPGVPRLRAILEGGSNETLRGSGFASGRRGHLTGALAGEWQGTAGVFVMAPQDRGPVDTRAKSDYRSGYATLGYDDGSWRAQVRVAGFREDRNNGTRLVVNDTSWRQLSAEAAGPLARGRWLARFSLGRQRYFNNFSAVSDDRSVERVTRAQGVPSDFATGSLEWARAWRGHAFLVGAEGHLTSASVEETRYSPAGQASGPFLTGGDEQVASLFGRASLAAGERLNVVLGARADFWRSLPSSSAAPPHDLSFVSPRVSLSWKPSKDVSLRASAARASRTPTLDELHRDFRVGDVVTEANPLLEPERLTGLELGALFRKGRLSARATAFWNRLDDAISNVTLETTPSLITRQKQNTDRTRAAGLELELLAQPHPYLTLSALAVATDSVFVRTPEQPMLAGRRIPQVPRYQLGGTATFAHPRLLTASLQVKALGSQFDDDLNQFRLGPFTVVDLYASRAFTDGVHAFVAVENLFDVSYDVARTPLRRIGWPRTLRAGVRLFRP